MSYTSSLKDRVKSRMAAVGINNTQLAALCGVKPPTSFNWQSGRTKDIKGGPLLLAAKALGVTPEWLSTGHDATRTMQTVSETRLARLAILVKKHNGSLADLNEAIGLARTDATLSQIRTKAPHSRTGKPRVMGDDLARKIEESLLLETGWMDTPEPRQPTFETIADLSNSRRVQLRAWIDRHCQGVQTAFLNDCARNGYELSQSELSGLLRNKSFGEKKARAIEKGVNMPSGYLDIRNSESTTDLMSIAERLKQSRENLGFTQAQLAKKAAVTQSAIANIENRIRKRPRELVSIARALNVDPSWLECGRLRPAAYQETQPGNTQEHKGTGLQGEYINSQASELITACLGLSRKDMEEVILFVRFKAMMNKSADRIAAGWPLRWASTAEHAASSK